jgi:aspartyl-tRNA(Asn)/glutamyl-tRNA(Gln) amidotransferase subunit A
LRAGTTTARALADAVIANITEREPEVHAFIEVFGDIQAQADAADKAGYADAPSLAGIPIAIKDNIVMRGKGARAGSKVLEGYVAPYDATAITKLRAAGAIFVGRTNLDEFAMGSSTERSAFGPTKNPLDVTRVPGGSSGGSAAAVAMGGALAALGSDTGGSIRQPASYCGLVGLKPTYGSVSRHGLIAMGSSLDVIGPLTHSVADAELIFNTISGLDPMDATTLPTAHVSKTATGACTIGVPRAFVGEGVDVAVRERFEASLTQLRAQGHTIVDIELPHIAYSLPAYYVIMPAEASTNLARYDGIRYGLSVEGGSRIEDTKYSRAEGFGPEVRRRIMLGTYVLSSGYYDAYYGKATAVRARIKAEFAEAFRSIDVIATPTTPSPAFSAGEKSNDPVAMYLEDVFTVSANIAGVPSISVPMGTVPQQPIDLPVGMQFMAAWQNESVLFHLGKAVVGEEA